jgi:hypothetical protein
MPLPGSPLMVSRNYSRQTSRVDLFPIHDHAVEELDTTTVSRIGDLMRDIAGERAGTVMPAFFLSRERLQIAASRATISRDLVLRTVLSLYSAPKRLPRFAWLPFRHNASRVICVVENKPLFHFAVAFRTLIVRFHHVPESNYLGERPGAFNAGKLLARTRKAFRGTTQVGGGKPEA